MAAFAALVLSSCSADDFEAPPAPDLYKTPYDFAVPSQNDGGIDQGVPDLKMPADLKQPSDDLTAVDSG